MTIKRIILFILSFIALFPVILSLLASLNEPQVQANLQIYLTNLTLHASEIKLDALVQQNDDSLKFLLGDEPYDNAKEQYQEVKKAAQNNIENSQKQALPPAKSEQIQQEIDQTKQLINALDINLGILEAQRGKTDEALTLWNDVIAQSEGVAKTDVTAQTATILRGLWSQPPKILAESETVINQHLKGWFRYKALEKLYQLDNRQNDISLLQNQEQEIAKQVLVKLVLINGLPILGGIIGFSLLIFFIVQLLMKKKESLLASINNLSWETPWGGETILQVLVVGFFFIGQIVLPLIFQFSGVNSNGLSLRGKAVYVLVSYILMAASGLLVLYFSIKPFFPLPKDWFRFQWLSNWMLWGIGGYFVALPLVFIVSLVNQIFWQGQGGSNPLLFLALESQDSVVLAIFFFTASIAAPFFEEIIFRGFLLPSLTRYVPVWGAIVISSLIFALAHLNLSEVLPLATLGIILGVVYTRSRNLLSSMLLHCLWNSGTLLSLFVLGSNA
ncbi:MAG: CPBP family glutamic-type intramembrane protease [Hydrococcus sp. Prado102]|nr:CPBP family glutamic-type intramembrane protease [Hydrococcus sp. Prado102]